MTNKEVDNEEETFFIDGHPIHILFCVFDNEKIYKILNSLSKIDYINNQIAEYDVVEFAYCIAFAKDDYAKDFLEKSADFFTSIEKIDPKHQLDLYLALKEKIKYHFQDDITKKRELLTMITETMIPANFEELPRHEQMAIRLDIKDAVISEKDKIISDIKTENDLKLKNKDKEIAELKRQLENLSKKDI